MTWEKKTEMCKMLNGKQYKEAVELFCNETDLDWQAVSMFTNGFFITEKNVELLLPYKEKILAIEPQQKDIRGDMRLSMIQDMLLKTKTK